MIVLLLSLKFGPRGADHRREAYQSINNYLCPIMGVMSVFRIFSRTLGPFSLDEGRGCPVRSASILHSAPVGRPSNRDPPSKVTRYIKLLVMPTPI